MAREYLNVCLKAEFSSFNRMTNFGIYSSNRDAFEREMGAINQDGAIALYQECPKQIRTYGCPTF